MGTFTNGTQGMVFEEMHCSKCIHRPTEETGCPVWDAHFLYSYELCNDKEHPGKIILDLLIPGDNHKCNMFIREKN